LVENLWDHLYPVLEDGDAELRAVHLSWMGERLGATVKAVPLVNAGYGWFLYKESRAVGYENPSATPEQKKAREKTLKEGKRAPEVFDQSFVSTPRPYYLESEKKLTASLAALSALDELCKHKFGELAPGFGKLREAMEEVRHTVHALFEKKGRSEPERAE